MPFTLKAIAYAWSGPLDLYPYSDHVTDGGWYYSTEQDVTVNVPTLEIHRGAENITSMPSHPKTTTVIVGQLIQLSGVFNNAGLPLTPLEYDWTIPGSPVANYKQTQQKGWIDPLIDAGSQEINYYWIAGGDGLVVSVELKVRGQPSHFDAQATFDANCPSWAFSSLTTTHVTRVNVGPVDTGLPDSLNFGSQEKQPWMGIRFVASVSAPAGGSGDIGLTQLIVPKNYAIADDAAGSRYTYKAMSPGPKYAPGQPVLDVQAPYAGDSVAVDDSATASLFVPGTTQLVNDTPHLDLDAAFKNVVLDEAFATYLMYKPAGGIWVAIALMNWSWSGAATKTAGVWGLDTGWQASVNPQGQKDSLEPTWNDNITDFQFAPR